MSDHDFVSLPVPFSKEERVQKRSFISPKLTFIQPKLTKQGAIKNLTTGSQFGSEGGEPPP